MEQDIETTSPPVESEPSLAPSHLIDLKKSGLTDEIIKESKAYSLAPRDINKKLGFNDPRIESVLVFPYPGCDGFEVYKVFPPRDGLKYVQRKGSTSHLYIPHSVQGILSDPSVPIYLTEGEKKTWR